MYKKSFFRGLGTGLIVGALTVTVAFNFDNAGKNNSDQGNTTKVVQQDNTENTGSTSETAKTTETEKNTTEKSTGKDNTKDAAKDSTKDTTEKVSSDTKGSNINGKGDVNSGGSNGKSTGDGSNTGNGNAGSTAGSDDKSSASTGDKSGTSTGNKGGSSSGDNNGSSQGGNDLSDNTQKVPSSKDNGYTEDKNSQSGSTATTEKTTEANTEAPKPSAIKYDNGGGQITIVDGMSAYEICQLLEQIGLRDADEYYDWLLRSGYSNSLVSGTYTFTGNETMAGLYGFCSDTSRGIKRGIK